MFCPERSGDVPNRRLSGLPSILLSCLSLIYRFPSISVIVILVTLEGLGTSGLGTRMAVLIMTAGVINKN